MSPACPYLFPLTARLTDREVADLMSWSEAQVAEIRKRDVDDSAIIVALTRRLATPL